MKRFDRPSRPPHRSQSRMRAVTMTPTNTPPSDIGKLFRIAGLPAVQAAFAKDPKRVEKLFYEEKMKSYVGEFCRILANAHKAYRQADASELERISGTMMHGGILALTQPKQVEPFDLEQARRSAANRKPLVMLDGIGNPHNLGAIARTCAFFGLENLVISDHPSQASISEAAWRVAEGGMEYVTVGRAVRFAGFLKRLKPFYHVVGTALSPTAKPLKDLRSTDTRPFAIVLGNEEEGLSPATLEACESIVTIPGKGWVQSLNVSATAAILIHELMTK